MTKSKTPQLQEMLARKKRANDALMQLFINADERGKEVVDFLNSGDLLIFAPYFRLDPTLDKDRPIIAAFEAAGLCWKNPLHWRELLEVFSDLHFGQHRGAPLVRTPLFYFQLIVDMAEVIKSKVLKRRELAKHLRTKSPYKSRYGEYGESTLIKMLQEACNPDYNVLLQHPEMRNPLLQLLRHGVEKKGVVWSPKVEDWYKDFVARCLAVLEQPAGPSEKTSESAPIDDS